MPYISLFLLMTTAIAAAAAVTFEPVEKPRVVVLTDITNEPDDEQSLVRFLVYTNEFDVEGLIATTSTWLRDKVVPQEIVKRIHAYGKVRDNLLKHAPGFPTAERLLSVTKVGPPVYGMAAVGRGAISEGARHIIQVVDRPDPRPVWISVWGGANTLAQALHEVRATRSKEELDRFVARLRVYTISDQDDSGRWIRVEFPGLFYVVNPSEEKGNQYYQAVWTGISGCRFYRNGPGHKWELVSNEWLARNIRSRGPLGELYPPWKFIMEGDTPSFLHLIDNGLGSALSPGWGGWGGRYQLHQTYGETRPIWTTAANGRDEVVADDGRTYVSNTATVWRWREAFQHDFAARMSWSVSPEYKSANHNPVVVVAGDKTKRVARIKVRSGEAVSVGAEGTNDPDGDRVSVRWWVYAEAGTHRGSVELKQEGMAASFTAPNVKQPADIHLICEASDNGAPSLFAYRRVIVTVEP
jgi:hypothetical protein